MDNPARKLSATFKSEIRSAERLQDLVSAEVSPCVRQVLQHSSSRHAQSVKTTGMARAEGQGVDKATSPTLQGLIAGGEASHHSRHAER